MKATGHRVTFAELQQWPEDGHQYELYDGEVVMVPAPVTRHQRVVAHLAYILLEYEKTMGGMCVFAPYDIVLDEHNVVQPDLVFFREERKHLLDQSGPSRLVPDLAIEVLSASTQARDRGRKMARLARFGVPEYWIVDPARNTIEIYAQRSHVFELLRAAGKHEAMSSITLPALSFSTEIVFAQ